MGTGDENKAAIDIIELCFKNSLLLFLKEY